MSQDAPEEKSIDGEGQRIAVVAARFNGEFVDQLISGVEAVLSTSGVKAEDVETVRVPGTHELPYAANELARSGRFHCVIALGVVIAGQTDHHRVVGSNTSRSLQEIAISARLPVINGVVVVDDRAQAAARCGGKIDRGSEFARAALEMGRLAQGWREVRES